MCRKERTIGCVPSKIFLQIHVQSFLVRKLLDIIIFQLKYQYVPYFFYVASSIGSSKSFNRFQDAKTSPEFKIIIFLRWQPALHQTHLAAPAARCCPVWSTACVWVLVTCKWQRVAKKSSGKLSSKSRFSFEYKSKKLKLRNMQLPIVHWSVKIGICF